MIGRDEIEDYEKGIQNADRDIKDFEFIHESDPIPSLGAHPATGKITITDSLSGVTRSYETGYGTHWVFDFETDLKAGLFN